MREKIYLNSFKLKVIEELYNGKSGMDIEQEYGVTFSTIMKWKEEFSQNGTLDNEKLSPKDGLRLKKLREKEKMMKRHLKEGRKGYEDSFKYKIIEELCNGKSVSRVSKEYGVSYTSVLCWLKRFASNGDLGKKDLSSEEKIKIEQLKEKAAQKVNRLRGTYTSSFKYDVIEALCSGKKVCVVAKEYNIQPNTAMKWLRDFIQTGPFEEELSLEEMVRIDQLREKAIKRENELSRVYDTAFKYKMIEELCSGKKLIEVEREYSVSYKTVQRWLKEFIRYGALDNEKLSQEEKGELRQLRERALRRKVEIKKGNSKYQNAFKYKVIEEFCDGASIHAVAKKNGISYGSVAKWIREFIENGVSGNEILTKEEKVQLEQLRERAAKREVKTKH